VRGEGVGLGRRFCVPDGKFEGGITLRILPDSEDYSARFCYCTFCTPLNGLYGFHVRRTFSVGGLGRLALPLTNGPLIM
jgi:hypothetical protein